VQEGIGEDEGDEEGIAGHDFSGPRLRSWPFHFCVSIFLLAFCPCIVHPHIGYLTNLAGYPPSKPNIIFCDYLLDHNLSLRMDHQFKEDRKTVPTLKNSSISPRKNISGTYLLYRLFARGRETSKHGGGGRYDAIFRVQKGSK
jgi:hypothetical protein